MIENALSIALGLFLAVVGFCVVAYVLVFLFGCLCWLAEAYCRTLWWLAEGHKTVTFSGKPKGGDKSGVEGSKVVGPLP